MNDPYGYFTGASEDFLGGVGPGSGGGGVSKYVGPYSWSMKKNCHTTQVK